MKTTEKNVDDFGVFWKVIHSIEQTNRFPVNIKHCFNCKHRYQKKCPYPDLIGRQNMSGLIARYCPAPFEQNPNKKRIPFEQTKLARFSKEEIKTFYRVADWMEQNIGFLPRKGLRKEMVYSKSDN